MKDLDLHKEMEEHWAGLYSTVGTWLKLNFDVEDKDDEGNIRPDRETRLVWNIQLSLYDIKEQLDSMKEEPVKCS